MWNVLMQLLVQKQSAIQIYKERRNMSIPKIGIAQIDHDHDMIINLLSKAEGSSNDVDYFDFSKRTLNYVTEHFASEEQYMININYPGFRIHHLEHESLRNFINVYLKPQITETHNKSEVFRECLSVFRFHILHHDMLLAKYVHEVVNV